MWWENEGHLNVRENQLHIGKFKASDLAEQYNAPLYVINGNRILENYNAVKDAFKEAGKEARIHYAMKANPNLNILKLLQKEGSWIDAVSPFEAKMALKAGFSHEKILFTGTSVSNADLELLNELGVRVNVDSFSQLRRMHKMGFKRKDISIRWNPGKGAGHHPKVITAGKHIKFGIPESKLEEIFKEASSLGFTIVGLHQHIGSGWLGKDVGIFLETVDCTISAVKKAEDATGKKLEFIDFGGGPGTPYQKGEAEFPLKEYANGIVEKMAASGLKAEIAIEPGRYLVGDAAVVLMEINTVEEKNVPIIGVGAGFTTFVRPAFYGSYHELVVCENVNGLKKDKFLVAGNLCESSDVFNTDKHELRELPVPEEGQHIALLNAGAYGYSQATAPYNSRPAPKEVMVFNGETFEATREETFEDLIRLQKLV